MKSEPTAFVGAVPLSGGCMWRFVRATSARRGRRGGRALACAARRVVVATARGGGGGGGGGDHYEVLGVSPTADAATIKRAYRRAALKNHPDVSKQPDARERFMRIQHAYAVLSDASKRASYDRHRSARAGASGAASFAKGFGFDFDAAQYASKWRRDNPMPEDINDSLGNIFSELFSGLAGAVGPNGVVEDFVDFLERRVDGFGLGGGERGDDSMLEEVLRSSDADVLQTEAEDARFLLRQLRARRERLEGEAAALRARAAEWGGRTRRAEQRREADVREAAMEREGELRRDARRFEERAGRCARLMRQQEARVEKIERRLQTVLAERDGGGQREGERDGDGDRGGDGVGVVGKGQTTTTTRRTGTGSGDNGAAQQAAIDNELDKMKRELGL